MKKLINALSMVVILAVAVLCVGAVANEAVSLGPAPNAGDGISDGSDLNSPYGNPDNPGPGSAPNSGDGIPDGSGF